MKFLKRLFCRHKHKRQRNYIQYIDGRAVTYYGKECRECGKVWKL